MAAARELLAGVAGRVVEVASGELAELAAEAAALVAAAEAVRASLVIVPRQSSCTRSGC